MRRILFLFSAFMLFSTQVFASGFAVKDQGTKAMGMANAYTAVADDTSAAWYNPAALAFQDGTSLTVGGQIVIPSVDFSGATTGSMDDKTHIIPFTYISYNSDVLPVTLGLAINAPFGLSTDWTNSTASFDFPARITFSQIQLININPVIAFKINDNLSIAGGASYYLVNKVAFDNSFVTQHGDGDGWGANAAIFYKSDDFNVGVTYRSRVKVKVSGTATGLSPLAGLGLAGVTSTVGVEVTLPDMISAGVAFHPADNWTLSAQYDWVNWKTFDELNFVYGASLLNAITGTSSSVPENWKASSSFSVGADWSINNKMNLRFGYAFDQTPVTDIDFSPRIVDNDRHFFTVGYGYNMSEKTTIDLAYGYIMVNDRIQTVSATPSYDGIYKANLHIVSASLTHRF
jgi:long-chain fatty acid transport protein